MKMKVLHICTFYQPVGGAERLLFHVLELLENRGVDNVVLAPVSQAHHATGRRRERFVDFLEYPFERSPILASVHSNRRLVRAIRRVIDDERPDVIHLHNQQNPFVYMACAATGLPMVHNVHDPRLYCPTNWRLLPDGRLCPYPLGRACVAQGCVKWRLPDLKRVAALALTRHASFRNTTLIIESRESYELALKNGYREDQLCFIPNCTRVPDLEVAQLDKIRHRAPGRHSLLFVGRASYEKGLEFMLRALTRVRHKFTLYLLTAGDYYQQTIAPLIDRLGLRPHVEVHLDTSYADTARYYSMADVVIVPSVWFETFCLVGIEAYARLTPVVATRVGGIKDWCVDGITGFLVDVFDEAMLASRIDTLLADPDLQERFARAGYRRVRRLYDEQGYFERLHALYERVVEHGTRDVDRLARVAGRPVQPGTGVSELQPEEGRP